MKDEYATDSDDFAEDPPPPEVMRAMSQIAIYAATHGDNPNMYLRDPVVAVPIAIVQEWLTQYGFTFEVHP